MINRNRVDDVQGQINNVIENEKEKKSDDGDEKEKDEVIKELEKEKIDTNYSNSRFKKQKSNTLIKRNDKFRFSHFQKNKNFLEKEEEENKEIKPEIENIEQLDLLDKLYDFKKFQIDELLILDEFDKITIEEDLKIKLKENMKQIISLIKKDHKTKDDYVKLFFCKKRIKHIIKKLSENDTKKNLITKSFKDYSSFPENIEERKQLYRLMRTIENKIREELDKVDNYEYKESSTSSEKDNNSNYENIYEILPIEDEEEKKVKRKKTLIDSKEKQKKDLIYDNLYLFSNYEEDEQNIEIKQEVIDILNTNKAEESFENKKKSEENFTPPKSPNYMIKKRRFRKTKKGTILRKLIDKEDINEKENNKISLDNRINNFFEQIQKLKKENVDDFDYDKILKELMIKQGENYGIINTQGDEKVPSEYEELKFASDIYYIAKKDGKYGIISTDNVVCLEFKYVMLNFLNTTNFYEAENEDYTTDIISRKLEVKLSNVIISELNTDKAYMRVRVDGQYKYYNFNFEEKTNVDVLKSNTLFLVNKNGKYGYTNNKGELIVDYIYDDAKEQNQYGYAAVKKDGVWGSLNSDGSIVLNPSVDLEDSLYIDFISTWHLYKDTDLNIYVK